MIVAYNYIVHDNESNKIVLNTFKLSDIYNFYNLNNIEDILNIYNPKHMLTIKPCNMSDII